MNTHKGMLFLKPVNTGLSSVSNALIQDHPERLQFGVPELTIESAELAVTVELHNSMLHEFDYLHKAKQTLEIFLAYVSVFRSVPSELQITDCCSAAIEVDIRNHYRSQCKLIRATRREIFELYEQVDKNVWTLIHG